MSLAWPVALNSLFWQAMALTDLAVLGHLGTDELAGASLAAIWQSITSTFLQTGMIQATRILGSQAYGAGNLLLVGTWTQVGLVYCLLACAPIAALWFFTEDVLLLVGMAPRVAALAGTFSRYSIAWLAPLTVFQILTAWLQVMGNAYAALIINALFAAVNLGLNVLLVHGVRHPGTRAVVWRGLGFTGSPIATTASRVGMLASFMLLLRCTGWHRATWGPGWTRECLTWRRGRVFLAQALPLTLGNCLEDFQMQLVAVLAGRLGTIAVATHTAVLNLFFLLTSFEFGAMTATSIRVGIHIGAGDVRMAKRSGLMGLGVGGVVGAAISVALVTGRDYLGHVFSRDPRVWAESAHIAWVVGAGYALLAFFYASMAVLEGQGNAGAVAVSFFLGAWVVCVPLAFVFTYKLHLGLSGLWYALTTGYAVVTVCSALFVACGNWQSRVEEARGKADRPLRIDQDQQERLLSIN